MSEWKKTASGRWVSTTAPNVPPRNAGAPRPPVPVASLADMDAKFVADPLTFMRKHAVSPPDNGSSVAGREFGRTTAAAGDIVAGDLRHGVITRNAAGGVRYVKLVQHPSSNFPGAVTLSFAPGTSQPDTGWLPIHWLPWYSLQIIQHAIPPVPSSLVDPPEQDFPRYFFTAGINGCSVFVTGESTGPTVYHAGITGTLGRPAAQFWRDQMAATGADLTTFGMKGEVNVNHYMFKDPKDSELATRFLKWQRDSSEPRFELDIQSSFGCVFGIMFGRHWSFYLQESVVMTSVHFVKQDAVNEVRVNQRIDFYERSSNLLATPQTIDVRRRLGMLPLPGKKKVVTYKVAKRSSVPMRVSEIYPNRHWSGELRDVFSSTSRV